MGKIGKVVIGVIITIGAACISSVVIIHELTIPKSFVNQNEQIQQSINLENEDKVNRTYADIKWLEAQIEDLKVPLGWLAILSDEKSFATEYHVSEGDNIFGQDKAKQLFVMEYILQNESYREKQFKTIIDGHVEDIDDPTDETIMAYLPIDFFERFCFNYFGLDVDIAQMKQPQGVKQTYLNEYIYYDNLRPGANGVNVTNMKITEINHANKSNVYGAILEITYSDRASEILGRKKDKAKLVYEGINKEGKETVWLKEFKIIEKDI